MTISEKVAFVRYINSNFLPINENIALESTDELTIEIVYDIVGNFGHFFIKNTNSFDKIFKEITEKLNKIREEIYK